MARMTVLDMISLELKNFGYLLDMIEYYYQIVVYFITLLLNFYLNLIKL